MGRRSKVKLYVDNMMLREYLVKSLVYNSYRELVENEEFVSKTNIGKLGTLTDWTGKKKYNITLEEIYEYGIENLMILPSTDYTRWLEETGRTNISRRKSNKTKTGRSQKSILRDIGTSIGLEFSNSDTSSDMTELLLDFMSQEEFDEKYKKFKMIGGI